MLKLVLQRFGLGVLTLFAASVLIFIGTEILPGDLASAILQNSATPESLAKLRLDLGLDQPGDRALLRMAVRRAARRFRPFARQRPRRADGNRAALRQYDVPGRLRGDRRGAAWRSVSGCWRRSGKAACFDRLVNLFTLMTISVPEYFLAYLLIKYVAVDLGWFPSLANVTPDTSFADRLYYAFLPMLTLVLVIVAHMMRMTRASVLSVMASPYIEMAILKGLTKSRIVVRHALPNALAPIISVDRAGSRLSHRRRRRRRDRVRLSRPRPIDGRRGRPSTTCRSCRLAD